MKTLTTILTATAMVSALAVLAGALAANL